MKISFFIQGLITLLILSACSTNTTKEETTQKIRPVVDTVGFSHLDWQTDSIVSRISTQFSDKLDKAAQSEDVSWRAAICPHDDYAYASWLYPAVLKNLKAKTLFIFGVAHRARNYNLENQIVFDSFDAWQGPYGPVKVSPLREKVMSQLSEDAYVVHDSMQIVEHSVESMIPFLQNQNKDVEIVSILVPYMPLSRIENISKQLAAAIQKVASEENLSWGKDYAILITSDAVHYGCEDWGGKNYDPLGCDTVAYEKAIEHEHEIIATCFDGELDGGKAEMFYGYTVKQDDFREYKWTWCGRYSVPMGLKIAWNLQQGSNAKALEGIPLGYETTISQEHVPVKDIRMGHTAIATIHHWVGFAAVGYK